ncbi:hypothetical protein IMZ48_04685 [Candidatus Bathyarchaeota archaeon]|nr:hypothetical protein [Candidatus Bathyarchaeota archaeon]
MSSLPDHTERHAVRGLSNPAANAPRPAKPSPPGPSAKHEAPPSSTPALAGLRRPSVSASTLSTGAETAPQRDGNKAAMHWRGSITATTGTRHDLGLFSGALAAMRSPFISRRSRYSPVGV